MTTPEFIKLIKACQEDRRKLLFSDWDFNNRINAKPLLISESELAKIEKVNVELLKICKKVMKSQIDGSYIVACAWWKEMKEAIENASNIKQI